jgi:1-acyl-sn-glycerol-3-phosphate acyltransferase
MAATLVVAVPVQALARSRGWAIQHAIQTGFCKLICAVLCIRVRREGVLPARRPRFVVANHLSWTDIIALASVEPFVFLAKSEVARWPALGLLARVQGTIFVERGARRDIPRVNAALVDVLQSGRDVVVFAEGTSTDGARPPRFKPSHFDAARDADAVIAPVALFYSDGARPVDLGWYGEMTFLPHLWGLMKRGGACCHLVFGAGVEPRGKDRKALAEQAQEQVAELLVAAQSDPATAPVARPAA